MVHSLDFTTLLGPRQDTLCTSSLSTPRYAARLPGLRLPSSRNGWRQCLDQPLPPPFPSHNPTRHHIKPRPNEKHLCALGPATLPLSCWRRRKEEEQREERG
ncbi:hypothetical protein AAFF_G00422360, partial [Aldrovandia affinis]